MFAPGSATATLSFDAVDDALVEGTEAFSIGIAPGDGLSYAGFGTVNGIIIDNDGGALPSVTIAPPAGPVTEGGALAFTLTRTGDLSQALTVNLNTTFAGANNFDLSAPSTAVFAPGSATAVANVQALDDTFAEASQGFALNITTGPGYVSGAAFSASATILDNDVAPPPGPLPTITIAATDGVGTEAIDGPDFTYTFTRTGDLSQALSVNYSINGSPPNITNPADFVTPATPFVMFAPDSATATLSFDALDDGLAEGTESFFIGIAPGEGLSYNGFGTTTGIIIDNDAGALPTVTIASPPGPATEGGVLAFTLTRTGDLSQPLTVNLNASNGTANSFDFTAPGSVVFAAGSATAVANVQALDDTHAEASQSFVLNIVPGPGYVSGVAFSASGTILDNDVAPPPGPLPTITIAATDGVGTEAVDGPDFTYTFTRTGDLSQALSVNYLLIGNPPNITNPADLVATTPFVTFAPGSATAILSFDAVDDALTEGTESFSIVITQGDSPLNYSGFGTANGIIIDNDNAVTLPFFQDNFSDGLPPPSAPNFANGNPASYAGAGVNGFEESGGRLIFDSDHAVAFDGPGTDDPIVGQNAILRSNIDPASPAGLKSSESFTVSGVFDLILPDSPREAYGIRLTDRLVGGNGTPPDQPGDDVIELVVRETPSGQVVVALREVDFAADSTTNIQSIALAPPPGIDQIRLSLAHSTSDVGAVVASFDYLAHGVVVGSQTLSQVGHIFGSETPGFTGDDENWTRAEIISYAPAQSDSVLSGVYGTLNINQAGTWSYNLDNTRIATQNLAQGETAAEHFTAQVADEFGATDTETITINVTGTNDAPIMQTAAVTRALTEGQSTPRLTATGLAQFSDLDLADTHTATATLQSTTASGGAVVSADLAAALQTAMTAHMVDPSTGDGHGQLQWDYAVANGDVGYLNAGQAVTAVYAVAVADPFGASAVEIVTITLNGIDGDLIPI